MTLAEEKELEIIKEGLTYVREDGHVNSPHWDSKYPWTQDPATLPNNKSAVQATFLRTERQLEREPEWKIAYTAQVHEMVERRAAIKLTAEMKREWKGPVWYISHLVAPNPHSVTTPVRLVWNSSQKFRGLSINDILLKGPDVLNPIRAVLLRFRQGVHAALGDIRKMYNSVWLEDREMHLHRFLWRDHPEEDIEEYAITSVNIGDKPAGCIAQLAMRETAKLPTFAYLQEERRVLDEDSYVDDILTSHNSLESLIKITQGVEEILNAGGFFLKPWVWSGQSGRQEETGDIKSEETTLESESQRKTIILPNQMRDEDNKALGVGYMTEDGPDFLKLPADEWPIKSPGEVAAQAKVDVDRLQRKSFAAAVTRSQAKQDKDEQTPQPVDQNSKSKGHVSKQRRAPAGWVDKLITVERFSSLQKTVDVVAWTWRAATNWREKKKGKIAQYSPVLTAAERQDALKDLFLAAQEGTTFTDTSLNRLVYRDRQGLLVCGGRFQMFTEGHAAVPILPFKSWISTLLAREAHNANHEGIAGTLLKMRKKAWVIKGRRLAKRVVDSCVTCRKQKAKQCQQIMSDLPPERVSPANPFEYTTVDLFGPYIVKDEVRKRVKLKVWAIVFCCMASRAIHTDLVSDQSSEGFLLAYQRFTSFRGHPKKLWSDPGSNFVGAKPALNELHRYLRKLNKSELENKAAKNGTEWSWIIHPADSPHRNGAAEAAVRLMKRALNNLAGDGIFTWSEFQTFLFMAANLVNERPIDARIQSREDCVRYVSPNCLLLGRASPKSDPATFNYENYTYKRLHTIQVEVNKFWKKWSQLAGPNLFIRSKWHTKKRNVAVGDVVWVADQNALRSQYKLGRVVQVNQDKKGVVRDANVRVFPSYLVDITKPTKRGTRSSIPATILHRDVRRLIVLLPIEEQTDP